MSQIHIQMSPTLLIPGQKFPLCPAVLSLTIMDVLPLSCVFPPFVANGSKIPTCGTISRHIHLGSHHFTGNVLITPVSCPIIEADFLLKHHLLSDMVGRRLLPRLLSSIPCRPPKDPSSLLSLVGSPHSSSYLSTLHEFPKVSCPEFKSTMTHTSWRHQKDPHPGRLFH